MIAPQPLGELLAIYLKAVMLSDARAAWSLAVAEGRIARDVAAVERLECENPRRGGLHCHQVRAGSRH